MRRPTSDVPVTVHVDAPCAITLLPVGVRAPAKPAASVHRTAVTDYHEADPALRQCETDTALRVYGGGCDRPVARPDVAL